MTHQDTTAPDDFNLYADLTSTSNLKYFEGSQIDEYDIGKEIKPAILKSINKTTPPLKFSKEIYFETQT